MLLRIDHIPTIFFLTQKGGDCPFKKLNKRLYGGTMLVSSPKELAMIEELKGARVNFRIAR